MLMSYPAPLRATFNPYTGSNGDSDITTPLAADGSNFPCRGALKVLGTDEAKPVVSWTAGEKYNLTISGGAPHGGGSCQAAISNDQGKTFTVIHTWIGGCPGLDGLDSSFDFHLPSDTPEGELVFAWTWFNRLGNREMYMDCSSIEVTGGSGSEPVAFANRPSLFIANINGCKTVDSKDVIIPNQGPDVTENGSETAPPTGDCEQASAGAAAPSSTSPISDVPTAVPSTVIDDPHSTAEPTPTVGDSFVTASPSSDSSDSVDDPGQTGSGSGDLGYEPGNDWPVDFSGAAQISPNVLLVLFLMFIAII